MKTKLRPYWKNASPEKRYPSLQRSLTVDVAIVGGGITGLTAAYLLKKAGKKVAVVERVHVGAGETGHTSGHLTSLLDTRYSELIEKFGEEGAREAYRSSQFANFQIQAIASELNIECDFKSVPAYLFATEKHHLDELNREIAACKKLGIPVEEELNIPVPFSVLGALRLDHQGQFHSQKYLNGLAASIDGDGSFIFEDSQVTEVKEGDPSVVVCEEGSVSAQKIIMATHSPTLGGKIMNTLVAAYRSYVLAAHLKTPPGEDGLYFDMEDPYHYIRNDKDLWIIGGEDHKTGQSVSSEKNFGRLESYTEQVFKSAPPECYWSGQILEPVDGLPYIGLAHLSKSKYIATGFSGNGLTFGTLAGHMISDHILGTKNPWVELYNPSRIKPLASMRNLILENKDFPICLIKDRIQAAELESLTEVKKDQGAIVNVDGKKLAVYRSARGNLQACSSICPHMGCQVHWNSLEKSWDCPCHGSRFDTSGKVMNGPSLKDLEPVNLQKQSKPKKTHPPLPHLKKSASSHQKPSTRN